MGEVAARVVAGPVLELHVGALRADSNAPEAAVLRDVGAGVPNEIVGRGIGNDAVEDCAEFVRIEERLPPRVFRERGERILGDGGPIELSLHRLSRKGAGSPDAGL